MYVRVTYAFQIHVLTEGQNLVDTGDDFTCIYHVAQGKIEVNFLGLAWPCLAMLCLALPCLALLCHAFALLCLALTRFTVLFLPWLFLPWLCLAWLGLA